MKMITGRRHWVLTEESTMLTTMNDNNTFITETSPYKSDPRFPPNIVKMGEIWGRNQNDQNG